MVLSLFRGAESNLCCKVDSTRGSGGRSEAKSKLLDADIAIITEWIRSGAVTPADQAR